MRIKTKLLIYFIFVALTPVFILSFIVLTDTKTRLSNEVTNSLEIIADTRKDEIQFYFDYIKAKFVDFSSDGKIKECLLNDRSQKNACSNEEFTRHLILNKLPAIDELEELSAVHISGEIIASTNSDLVGIHIENTELFKNGIEFGDILSFEKNDNQFKIQVIQKVNRFTNSDDVIGFLIATLSTIKLEELVVAVNSLGETGEVVLAIDDIQNNPDFIFDRRFESQAVSSPDYKSAEPMRYALNKKELSIKNSLDYRNISVSAVTRYIPIDQTVIGLVAKKDIKEINIQFSKLERITLFFLLVSILLAVPISVVVSRSFSRPIEEISEKIKGISKGNYKIDISQEARNSSYELGGLSDEIIHTARNLGNLYISLDQKVKEETEKLNEKVFELEDARKAITNVLEDVEIEKERVEIILQSIGDAVFVIDMDFNIIIFNEACSKISGYSADEVLGMPYSNVLKFVTESDEKVTDDFIKKAISTGEVQQMERNIMLVKKDKTKIAVADSSAPLKDKDGVVTGVVVVFRNVSEERNIDKAKTEFVSLASHQLRTPLSSMGWFVEMLLDKKTGKINQKQRDYLNEVYAGKERMAELISALLSVSRLELGTFNVDIEEVDPVKIINEVLVDLKFKIQQNNIELQTIFPKRVLSIENDHKLLTMIFQNLLSNAVKYTPKGGEIKVVLKKIGKGKTIKGVVVNADSLFFEVTDTGIGIPKEQVGKIFSKLFRADNVNNVDTDGTGLGLYIVKSVTEVLKGQLWFKTKENKGTSFFCVLPIKHFGTKKKSGNKLI